MIIDYKVVEKRSPHDMEMYVKAALLQGWQPLGGVTVSWDSRHNDLHYFTQVLVKYSSGVM